jgi:predicted nucleotidyltransferase
MTVSVSALPVSVPEDLRKKLTQAVVAVTSLTAADLVALFGSWAEGRGRGESDIDLLVVTPTTERLHLTIRLKRALRPVLGGMSLDLFVLTPEEWEQARRRRGTIGWEADQFGVKLYERQH